MRSPRSTTGFPSRRSPRFSASTARRCGGFEASSRRTASERYSRGVRRPAGHRPFRPRSCSGCAGGGDDWRAPGRRRHWRSCATPRSGTGGSSRSAAKRSAAGWLGMRLQIARQRTGTLASETARRKRDVRIPDTWPARDRAGCRARCEPHFGRIASAVPWMKAWIFTTCAGVSLPVKSGIPFDIRPFVKTKRSSSAIVSVAE